jgi:raffinose/stachyose/melibiose transport system substrate-binding protein
VSRNDLLTRAPAVSILPPTVRTGENCVLSCARWVWRPEVTEGVVAVPPTHGRSRRRKSTTAVFLAVLLVAASACSSSGGSSSGGSSNGAASNCGSSSETVTLRIAQTSSFKAGQDIVNANFQRECPNIHLELTYLDPQSLTTQLQVGLQTGSGPDIFQVLFGNSSAVGVWPLAKAGRLMNLSDQPWVGDIAKSTRPIVSFNGKAYAQPLNVGTNGILYNMDLWNRLGLTAPTTVNDLLSLCRKVSAAGKVMFAAGMAGAQQSNSTLGLVQSLMNEFVFNIDPNWTAERNAGKVKFVNSPLWRSVYQVLLQMQDGGCFNKAPWATSFPEASALIATGGAVAAIISPALIAIFKGLNPNLNLALTPLPSFKVDDMVVSGNGASMAVNAATKLPKEARAFLNFQSKPDQSRAFAKGNNVIAPVDAKQGSNLPAYMDKIYGTLYSKGKVVDSPFAAFPNSNVFFTVLGAYIPGILSGQVSIDKLLQDADYFWDHPDATSAP